MTRENLDPRNAFISGMTPAQFEQFVEATLRSLDYFQDAQFFRNTQFSGVRQPGDYEIDIAVRAKLGGFVDFLMLIECKNWKRPVDRPVVQKLAQTRDAVAAHKAVIVSPVGFSKEAVDVAASFGIGLWVLAEANSRLDVIMGYMPDITGLTAKMSRITTLSSLGFNFRRQFTDHSETLVRDGVDETGRPLEIHLVDGKYIFGHPGREMTKNSYNVKGEKISSIKELFCNDYKQITVSAIANLPFPIFAISKCAGVLKNLPNSCEVGHDRRLAMTLLAEEILRGNNSSAEQE